MYIKYLKDNNLYDKFSEVMKVQFDSWYMYNAYMDVLSHTCIKDFILKKCSEVDKPFWEEEHNKMVLYFKSKPPITLTIYDISVWEKLKKNLQNI